MKKLLQPWRSTRTLWAMSMLSLDLLITWVPFALLIALLATSVGLLITYPLATPFIWLMFLVAKWFGKLERSRIYALLDIDIADPHQPLTSGSWWNRIWQLLTSASRWREIAYFVITPIYGTIFAVLAFGLWAGSLLLITLPFSAGSFPGGSAEFGLFNVGPDISAFIAGLIGLVGLLIIAPWVTIGLTNVRGVVAQALLAPNKKDSLRQQVHKLETSRSAAVEGAEAERRRIERDLHDGAQQRLVVLAMDLDRARQHFDNDPDTTRDLLASVHEEAKAALGELRDLVRGIHPAILSDRGLDAALSAIVARSPIPVQLNVNLSERPPASVESAAYFIVTEAITNAMRHAEASHIRIDIHWKSDPVNGDQLIIDIQDDGHGGADPAKGSGLRGLQERITALGGWMDISSPTGGPTNVKVALPCVS